MITCVEKRCQRLILPLFLCRDASSIFSCRKSMYDEDVLDVEVEERPS